MSTIPASPSVGTAAASSSAAGHGPRAAGAAGGPADAFAALMEMLGGALPSLAGAALTAEGGAGGDAAVPEADGTGTGPASGTATADPGAAVAGWQPWLDAAAAGLAAGAAPAARPVLASALGAAAGAAAAAATASPGTAPGAERGRATTAAGAEAQALFGAADARALPVAQDDAAALTGAGAATALPLVAVAPQEPTLATTAQDAAPPAALGAVDAAPAPLLAAAPAGPVATQAPAPAAPVHAALLPTRPGDAAFAGDLATEVRVMLEGGVQQAELRLNPAELGPIQIQLRVAGGSADISFAVQHAATRDGIAGALPELREMLASQGLALGHAGVGAGQQQPQHPQDARAQAGRDGASERSAREPGDGAGAAGTGTATVLRGGRGLLDLYA